MRNLLELDKYHRHEIIVFAIHPIIIKHDKLAGLQLSNAAADG
jgi:hypothetical protein